MQVTNTVTKAGAHLHDQRPGRERRPFSRAELRADRVITRCIARSMSFWHARYCACSPSCERGSSAFHSAAESKQGQAEQHRAGKAQDACSSWPHAVSLTSLSVRDKVARNAYSRLVQYETGRGGTAKPTR